MGGFRHTGVGDATARDQYAAVGQAQDSAFQHGTVGGAADAITLTLSPAITAYAAGQRFSFVAGSNNTGTVSGLAAKAVQKRGAPLVAGDIKSGHLVEIVYDGTHFQMVSPGLGGWELIGTATANGSAIVDFEPATIGDGTYAAVMLVMNFVQPASDGVAAQIHLKKNGAYSGSPTGYANWTGGGVSSSASYGTPNTGSGSMILTRATQGNGGAQENLSGVFILFHPGVAAASFATSQIVYGDTSASTNPTCGGHLYNPAYAVTGVRFQYSSGNVSAGNFYLFGLRA